MRNDVEFWPAAEQRATFESDVLWSGPSTNAQQTLFGASTINEWKHKLFVLVNETTFFSFVSPTSRIKFSRETPERCLLNKKTVVVRK